MTWAPSATQKAIFETLANDPTLVSLLNAVYEKQRLVMTFEPVSGHFVLKYNDAPTASIDGATLSELTIQSALRLIEGLEQVVVTKISSLIYEVEFVGVAGFLNNLVVSDNTLEDNLSAPVVVTVSKSRQAIQKVYDFVPDNVKFPYVVLEIKPWTDRGSHTLEGLQCDLQINVWYQVNNRGNLPVQNIQNRIDELLHKKDICIDTWNVVGLRRSFVDIITDPDNVTKQGVQRFNLLIGEA